ncbi:unnamed protein product [Rotaria magnacalcarata]|uniref:Uncharacterized protein n=1 Tax=Rotaria magnacalcarata TaxID=392030 RepID=A0A820N938_9BILA|nr:unnamed protein product [Rotaria magnacalcarata]CAF4384390.1 unnamed protein product [Rotaria magnacalcarata]
MGQAAVKTAIDVGSKAPAAGPAGLPVVVGAAAAVGLIHLAGLALAGNRGRNIRRYSSSERSGDDDGGRDPSRGLNAEADSIEEANRMIVQAMIEYINANRDLSEAARVFIIHRLRTSRPLNCFHLNCTRFGGVVQVDEVFHCVSGNGSKEWNVTIRIDVDNPPDDRAHMGYEIYINGRRVQSGHVYTDAVEIGRPGLHKDHLLTTEEIEGGSNVPLIDKKGHKNGKVDWKCISKRF